MRPVRTTGKNKTESRYNVSNSNTEYSTARSAELFARGAKSAPGGVHSNVRITGPQIYIDRAKGSRITDVDGNEYVDYLLGQGPNFLGHAPDRVLDAVAKASERGMIYGAQHELEIEAGEKVLSAVKWGERLRFGLSGTEAVQAALRLARAVTGREKFVRFGGQYHGWLDNVLVGVGPDGSAQTVSAGQLPSHLDDSIMIAWNDLSAVEELLASRTDEIAAVIMEPVMLNAGSIEPAPGYLEGVRAACDRHGVVLIFDEVIAGFRVALGGAAERYGVTPDLATYGKALAGGWPVSALVGRADYMDRFGNAEVNHSGTFNASVMACAATAATIDILTSEPPYERLADLGGQLQAGIRSIAAERGVAMNVQGLPMAFHVSFGDGPVTSFQELSQLDLARYVEFSKVLVESGIWVTGRGIWYVSAAHDQADVDETLERFSTALTRFLG